MARKGCSYCGEQDVLVYSSLTHGNLCMNCYKWTEGIRTNAQRLPHTKQFFEMASSLKIDGATCFALTEMFKRYLVNPEYFITFDRLTATIHYIICYRRKHTPATITIGKIAESAKPSVIFTIEFDNATTKSIDRHQWIVVPNGKKYKLVEYTEVERCKIYSGAKREGWKRPKTDVLMVDQFSGSEVEGMFRDAMGVFKRKGTIPDLSTFLSPVEYKIMMLKHGLVDGYCWHFTDIAKLVQEHPDNVLKIAERALTKCRIATGEALSKQGVIAQKFPKEFIR